MNCEEMICEEMSCEDSVCEDMNCGDMSYEDSYRTGYFEFFFNLNNFLGAKRRNLSSKALKSRYFCIFEIFRENFAPPPPRTT